jgi:hypothetical protein
MAPTALQAWEAVIQTLQALGSDDIQIICGPTPSVIVSQQTADAAEKALQYLQDIDSGDRLRQASKKAWSTLLSSKVRQSLCRQFRLQQVREAHYCYMARMNLTPLAKLNRAHWVIMYLQYVLSFDLVVSSSKQRKERHVAEAFDCGNRLTA